MACTCQHQESSPVEVKTPEPVKRGRAAVGERETEPLIGIAESAGDHVACCGGCPEQAPGAPKAIKFEKCVRKEGGELVFEPLEGIAELSPELVKRYESQEHMCLPWVRVQRDPARFRACLERARSIGRVEDSKKIFELTRDYLAKQDQEVFLVLLLDVQLQVRGISEIVRGERDRVEVPIPDALRIAIVDGATSMVVVHNHPSGKVRPSDADGELTEHIRKAAQTIKVPLMDHVIVGVDRYYSFADAGRVPI